MKPRNPHATAAWNRRAGAHDKGSKRPEPWLDVYTFPTFDIGEPVRRLTDDGQHVLFVGRVVGIVQDCYLVEAPEGAVETVLADLLESAESE